MTQPNLLIIMSDEHQARAMGCAGHPFVQTPNLDALAARGMRFTDAYTPSPICVPARAAFASGRYVHVNRLWDNAMPYTGEPKGWGHRLQDAGVPVESIGKLHYRHHEDPAGFDTEHIPMQVVNGVGMVWASIRKEDERVGPPGGGRMLGEYIGPGQSKYTEYDAAVTERTGQWFAQRAASGDDRPWCLYVGLVAPHFPLIVPQEFYDLYPLDRLPPVKLHPDAGHARHPWVEKQNVMMDSETRFKDTEERLSAMASYYGLCSWLDHNVGQVIGALGAAGFGDNTTVIYTSDHGDNVGARGLWGKSNLYQESVAVPLIMAGPGIAPGTCETPVSLLDISATVPDHFGLKFEGDGVSLARIAEAEDDPERPILSEYHAAGAVSGAFMLRKGRWKLNYYVGFASELYDMRDDPEELTDLAADPIHAETLTEMETALRAILDPEAVDAQAFADQAELIASHGGREAALKLGAPGATPPPEAKS
ncbi:sulfatase-like hydrolase/transferase [Alisedimentitalea sp. MJ-SS2]|uniref:sulfatase-like hydrolase/transferase n=1 Tax=Aliisedimentitalea sp. MJ-SS2 TaxID=3049795 RepID=UPI002913EA1F|nr:sulfatase-like hydrolase/transferase [Alisedimentitalea sp. MJ-SS2]MDU8927122.1 sulfatase-like hydrolase/transferase [Alisedimentitalea sp. MJ-SS2]